MKKLLILALVLFASVAFAAAEDMTFKGWVADEACAKDFAKAGNAEHKGCATGCLSRGGGVALVSEAGSTSSTSRTRRPSRNSAWRSR